MVVLLGVVYGWWSGVKMSLELCLGVWGLGFVSWQAFTFFLRPAGVRVGYLSQVGVILGGAGYFLVYRVASMGGGTANIELGGLRWFGTPSQLG